MIPEVGDRVRITGILPNDPDPLPIGLMGTVQDVNPDVDQIYVTWDPDSKGRIHGLILLTDDPFVVVRADEEER